MKEDVWFWVLVFLGIGSVAIIICLMIDWWSNRGRHRSGYGSSYSGSSDDSSWLCFFDGGSDGGSSDGGGGCDGGSCDGGGGGGD